MVDTPGLEGKMCDWEHIETIPFAEEALKNISSKSPVYIATAAEESSPEDIEKAFRRVGLNHYIKGYFCRQNTGFTKPSPEFYETVMKTLSVTNNAITMVGDNFEKDILPCHQLGFNTIWLTSGQNKKVPEGVRVIATLRELCS